MLQGQRKGKGRFGESAKVSTRGEKKEEEEGGRLIRRKRSIPHRRGTLCKHSGGRGGIGTSYHRKKQGARGGQHFEKKKRFFLTREEGTLWGGRRGRSACDD